MKNVFVRFLSTYILILLLPLIMGWTIYRIVLKEFESYIKSTHLALLNQTREIIDRYTKAIESRVFQIANNTKLKRLIYKEEQSIRNNIYLIREIVNELDSYVIYTSDFNTTFYIYLKDLNLIITPNSSYQLEDFNRGGVFFSVEGSSAPDWHKQSISQYYTGVFLETKTMVLEDFNSFQKSRVVPYIRSLPLGYQKTTAEIIGVILFFIREEEFTALLNSIKIPQGGWAFITDETGKVITSSPVDKNTFLPLEFEAGENEGLKKTVIAGKEMFVIYTTSVINDWKYIAVLPTEFVLDKVEIIQVVSLVVILLATLVSIILAIIIAYRRAQPIKEMINLVRDSHEANPVSDLSKMDVLSGSINRIINRNQAMQNQLQEQIKFVRSTFFNNLLNGYFRNNHELNSFLKYAGISISETRFIVMLLYLAGYESLGSTEIITELQKMKVIVKSTMEQVFTENIFFSDIDERKIAVILPLKFDQDEECSEYLNLLTAEFYQKLAAYYQGKPLLGIGNICHNLLEINSSFEKAKETLNYLIKTGKESLAWFSQLHKETHEYYFPLELEMRLLNSTKAGDQEQLIKILHTIYDENFKNRNLLPEKLRELFYEMHGTLIKIKNHITLEKNINLGIDLNDQADIVFRSLQQVYFSICDQINTRKKSHNKELINRIISFLEKEYSNPNLCLYSVASHFSINESYLSYFYKEQTGMNFSFYLEKVRMDHATQLLNNTNLAIKEITNYAGYHSDKTFRRVFKRVKGISPSRFRQERLRNAPDNSAARPEG